MNNRCNHVVMPAGERTRGEHAPPLTPPVPARMTSGTVRIPRNRHGDRYGVT